MDEDDMVKDVKQWLKSFNCEMFAESFNAHGYKTLESLRMLDVEQLRSMGIRNPDLELIMSQLYNLGVPMPSSGASVSGDSDCSESLHTSSIPVSCQTATVPNVVSDKSLQESTVPQISSPQQLVPVSISLTKSVKPVQRRVVVIPVKSVAVSSGGNSACPIPSATKKSQTNCLNYAASRPASQVMSVAIEQGSPTAVVSQSSIFPVAGVESKHTVLSPCLATRSVDSNVPGSNISPLQTLDHRALLRKVAPSSSPVQRLSFTNSSPAGTADSLVRPSSSLTPCVITSPGGISKIVLMTSKNNCGIKSISSVSVTTKPTVAQSFIANSSSVRSPTTIVASNAVTSLAHLTSVVSCANSPWASYLTADSFVNSEYTVNTVTSYARTTCVMSAVTVSSSSPVSHPTFLDGSSSNRGQLRLQQPPLSTVMFQPYIQRDWARDTVAENDTSLLRICTTSPAQANDDSSQSLIKNSDASDSDSVVEIDAGTIEADSLFPVMSSPSTKRSPVKKNVILFNHSPGVSTRRTARQISSEELGRGKRKRKCKLFARRFLESGSSSDDQRDLISKLIKPSNQNQKTLKQKDLKVSPTASVRKKNETKLSPQKQKGQLKHAPKLSNKSIAQSSSKQSGEKRSDSAEISPGSKSTRSGPAKSSAKLKSVSDKKQLNCDNKLLTASSLGQNIARSPLFVSEGYEKTPPIMTSYIHNGIVHPLPPLSHSILHSGTGSQELVNKSETKEKRPNAEEVSSRANDLYPVMLTERLPVSPERLSPSSLSPCRPGKSLQLDVVNDDGVVESVTVEVVDISSSDDEDYWQRSDSANDVCSYADHDLLLNGSISADKVKNNNAVERSAESTNEILLDAVTLGKQNSCPVPVQCIYSASIKPPGDGISTSKNAKKRKTPAAQLTVSQSPAVKRSKSVLTARSNKTEKGKSKKETAASLLDPADTMCVGKNVKAGPKSNKRKSISSTAVAAAAAVAVANEDESVSADRSTAIPDVACTNNKAVSKRAASAVYSVADELLDKRKEMVSEHRDHADKTVSVTSDSSVCVDRKVAEPADDKVEEELKPDKSPMKSQFSKSEQKFCMRKDKAQAVKDSSQPRSKSKAKGARNRKRAAGGDSEFADDKEYANQVERLHKKYGSSRKHSQKSATKPARVEHKMAAVLSGPVVRIRGPKEQPVSVSVVAGELDADEESERKSKKRHFRLDPSWFQTSFEMDDTIPWLCVFCHRYSNYHGLGDLFGPYFRKNVATGSPTSALSHAACASPAKGKRSPAKLSPPAAERSSAKKSPEDCERSSSSKAQKTKSRVQKFEMISARSDKVTSIDQVPYEMWVHEDCAIWTSGVCILGFQLHGLEEAAVASLQAVCTTCHTNGATLGCYIKGCNVMYHYLCAVNAGCSFNDENFTILCANHKNKKLKLLSTAGTCDAVSASSSNDISWLT